MRLLKRIESQVVIVAESGCWIWMGGESQGYPRMSVENRTTRVHRLVYTLTRGDLPADAFVCHRCDVPLCVNPEHLFAGSPRDNYDDMVQKGRRGRPAPKKPHRVKLTAAQIEDIRKRFLPGTPGHAGSGNADELALEHRVHRAHIHRVAKRKCWSETWPDV